MRIIVVEDDLLIGDGIQVALGSHGYVVDWVTDGEHAINCLKTENYDLCILDIGLPKINGLDVLKNLRGQKKSLPVILLTARDARGDKVQGLDAGADDYLTKPFELEELLARIRAVTRRAAGQAHNLIEHADLIIDIDERRVSRAGASVPLSAKEYALLLDLMMHRNHIRTKDELENSLYGWGAEVESNAIEVHMHHLRRKLGGIYIKTVRSMGYTIENP
jgi:DNA-binding response OmpR family regulator